MPTYTILGKQVTTAAPLTDAQIDEIAQDIQREAPKEKGLLAGLKSGTDRFLSSSAAGLESMFGDATEAGKRANVRDQERNSRFEEQIGLDKLKDVYAKEGLYGGAKEVARQVPLALAEQAPNLAAMAATAKLGAMAGTAVAPGPGTLIGGALGAFAPSALSQLGSNVARQTRENPEAPVEMGKAGTAAVLQGGLETVASAIPLGKNLVGKLLGPQVEKMLAAGGTKAAEKLAAERLVPMLAKGTAVGVAAEVPTEVTQSLLERWQAGKELFSPDALKEYGDTAYQTALLGPIGAVGRTADRSAARTEVETREKVKTATDSLIARGKELTAPAPYTQLNDPTNPYPEKPTPEQTWAQIDALSAQRTELDRATREAEAQGDIPAIRAQYAELAKLKAQEDHLRENAPERPEAPPTPPRQMSLETVEAEINRINGVNAKGKQGVSLLSRLRSTDPAGAAQLLDKLEALQKEREVLRANADELAARQNDLETSNQAPSAADTRMDAFMEDSDALNRIRNGPATSGPTQTDLFGAVDQTGADIDEKGDKRAQFKTKSANQLADEQAVQQAAIGPVLGNSGQQEMSARELRQEVGEARYAQQQLRREPEVALIGQLRARVQDLKESLGLIEPQRQLRPTDNTQMRDKLGALRGSILQPGVDPYTAPSVSVEGLGRTLGPVYGSTDGVRGDKPLRGRERNRELRRIGQMVNTAIADGKGRDEIATLLQNDGIGGIATQRVYEALEQNAPEPTAAPIPSRAQYKGSIEYGSPEYDAARTELEDLTGQYNKAQETMSLKRDAARTRVDTAIEAVRRGNTVAPAEGDANFTDPGKKREGPSGTLADEEQYSDLKLRTGDVNTAPKADTAMAERRAAAIQKALEAARAQMTPEQQTLTAGVMDNRDAIARNKGMARDVLRWAADVRSNRAKDIDTRNLQDSLLNYENATSDILPDAGSEFRDTSDGVSVQRIQTQRGLPGIEATSFSMPTSTKLQEALSSDVLDAFRKKMFGDTGAYQQTIQYKMRQLKEAIQALTAKISSAEENIGKMQAQHQKLSGQLTSTKEAAASRVVAMNARIAALTDKLDKEAAPLVERIATLKREMQASAANSARMNGLIADNKATMAAFNDNTRAGFMQLFKIKQQIEEQLGQPVTKNSFATLRDLQKQLVAAQRHFDAYRELQREKLGEKTEEFLKLDRMYWRIAESELADFADIEAQNQAATDSLEALRDRQEKRVTVKRERAAIADGQYQTTLDKGLVNNYTEATREKLLKLEARISKAKADKAPQEQLESLQNQLAALESRASPADSTPTDGEVRAEEQATLERKEAIPGTRYDFNMRRDMQEEVDAYEAEAKKQQAIIDAETSSPSEVKSATSSRDRALRLGTYIKDALSPEASAATKFTFEEGYSGATETPLRTRITELTKLIGEQQADKEAAAQNQSRAKTDEEKAKATKARKNAQDAITKYTAQRTELQTLLDNGRGVQRETVGGKETNDPYEMKSASTPAEKDAARETLAKLKEDMKGDLSAGTRRAMTRLGRELTLVIKGRLSPRKLGPLVRKALMAGDPRTGSAESKGTLGWDNKMSSGENKLGGANVAEQSGAPAATGRAYSKNDTKKDAKLADTLNPVVEETADPAQAALEGQQSLKTHIEAQIAKTREDLAVEDNRFKKRTDKEDPLNPANLRITLLALRGELARVNETIQDSQAEIDSAKGRAEQAADDRRATEEARAATAAAEAEAAKKPKKQAKGKQEKSTPVPKRKAPAANSAVSDVYSVRDEYDDVADDAFAGEREAYDSGDYGHAGGTQNDAPLTDNMRYALETGDTSALLGAMEKEGDADIRALAAKLRAFVSNVEVSMERGLTFEGRPAEGTYDSGQDIAVFDRDTATVEVVAHELTHAATIQALAAKPENRTKEQNAAVEKLEKLYGAMKANPKFKGKYATQSLAEFVAEVYARPKLRAEMDAVGKPQSLLQRFVQFFKDILRLNDSQKAMRAIEKLLQVSSQPGEFPSGKRTPRNPDDERRYASQVSATHEGTNIARIQTATQDKRGFFARMTDGLGMALETGIVDMHAPLFRALKAAGGESNKNTMQAMYSSRKADQSIVVVQQTLSRGYPTWAKGDSRGLVGAVVEDGISGADVMASFEAIPGKTGEDKFALGTEYLSALRMVQKNRDLMGAGSLTSARKLLADVKANPAAYTALEAMRAKYKEYNTNLVNFVRESGAISAAEAKEYLTGDYVPLYRNNNGKLELSLSDDAFVSIGDIKHTPFLHKLKGSDAVVMPLNESIIYNTKLLVDMAMSNKQKKDISFAMAEVGDAAKKKATMRVRTGKGETRNDNNLYWRVEPVNKDDDGYRHMVLDTEGTVMDGVPTDVLANAMKGFHATMPAYVRWSATVNDYLRAGVTRTPAYLLRQLARDPIAASSVTGLKAGPLQAVFNTVSNFAESYTKDGKRLVEMNRRALVQSNVMTGDVDDMAKLGLQIGGPDGASATRKFLNFLDKAAHNADAATRKQIWDDAKAQGLSDIEAEYRVMESMNFHKRGGWETVQHANRMLPFFNSAVQGLNVATKALQGKMPFEARVKARQKYINNAMWILAYSAMYSAAMSDDDEYNKLKPEDRIGNLHVPLPGGGFFKVPVGYVDTGGLAWATGQYIAEQLRSDTDARQTNFALGKYMLGAVPGGGGVPLPPVIKQIAEYAAEYDLGRFQRTISKNLSSLDPEQQYNENTLETFKTLGQATGLSPIKLQRAVDTLFSNAASGALGLLEMTVGAGEKEGFEKADKGTSRLPFISGFTQNDASSKAMSFMYSEAGRMVSKADTYSKMRSNGRSREDLTEYLEENRVEIQLAPMGRSFMTQMGQLNKAIKQIQEGPGDGATKQERIKALQKRQDAMSQSYMQKMKAAEKRLEAMAS